MSIYHMMSLLIQRIKSCNEYNMTTSAGTCNSHDDIRDNNAIFIGKKIHFVGIKIPL